MNQRGDGSIRLLLALCCWAAAALSFLGISCLAWILRDGLGPNSVASRGWVALDRLLNEAGWSLLVAPALLLSGLLLYWSDTSRAP